MRLTPPEQRSPTTKFSQSSTSPSRLAGAVAAAALAVFTWGLTEESFVDEYAYITQSYYSDLFFGGHRNDAAWLEFLALDLQPLPKYFIGPGLHAAGIRMPGPRDAYRWYSNAHYRFGPPLALTVARIPFIATGLLGCLALLGFGALIGGRWVGVLASGLLIANPLYRLHAHRAMSDVPCEAFMIASLGLGMWGWARIWSRRGVGLGMVLFLAAGVSSGLAIVCKLNGLLAPIVLGAWCAMGALMPAMALRTRLAFSFGAALSLGATASTMLALNPTLTCHPRGELDRKPAARAGHGALDRFGDMVKYRLDTVAGQREMKKFYRDIVRGPVQKAAVFAVQGFGRFGPFGPSQSNSEVRYDLKQDWGSLLWWPLILLGMIRSFHLGRRQLRDGRPPTAFALLIWTLTSWAVVGTYIPLAWDRYFLPIQAPDALVAAVGLSALWEGRRRQAVPA